MLSDSIHSFTDVFSTLIVIVGVKVANKKADKEHPYGHERFESVAAVLLAVLLGATGTWDWLERFTHYNWENYDTIAIPV